MTGVASLGGHRTGRHLDVGPARPRRRTIARTCGRDRGTRLRRHMASRDAGLRPDYRRGDPPRRDGESLGPGRLLAPEQAVLLETDPAAARELARTHMWVYLGLRNYANNLRRLGYSEEDLASGGSDRLVDDLVAWGGVDAARDRV